MGFFGSNKIDFPSPIEGSLDVGCSRKERRNFLRALLYITITIEMVIEGANHVLVHCPTFPWAYDSNREE